MIEQNPFMLSFVEACPSFSTTSKSQTLKRIEPHRRKKTAEITDNNTRLRSDPSLHSAQ